MSIALQRWLLAFVFTQLVEVPIYRRFLPVTVVAAAAASLITHPFVWFAFPQLMIRAGWSYLAMGVSAELFAWLAEAVWMRHLPTALRGGERIGWSRTLLVTLVANGASLGLGLLSRRLFGSP